MSVSIAQVTAGTASTLLLDRVPPGATVILAVADTNADVAWGTGSAVTYATGSLVAPYAATVFTNPATAGAFTMYVISNTGTHEISATLITPGP